MATSGATEDRVADSAEGEEEGAGLEVDTASDVLPLMPSGTARASVGASRWLGSLALAPPAGCGGSGMAAASSNLSASPAGGCEEEEDDEVLLNRAIMLV
jgi:hypothetical protein